MHSSPRAVILCAGVGRRLEDAAAGPKVLLRFGGRSLLERHLAILDACGIAEVALVVGHRRDLIEAELARIARRPALIDNSQYRAGSALSLHAARDFARGAEPLLLMDGDVLYDRRLMDALLADPAENVLLLDRAVEPGDEPVKICVREGSALADFAKVPRNPYDWYGESVGFFRLSARTAAALAERVAAYAAAGCADAEYEAPLRDAILAAPERFAFADVTGLPWTEIDFPADVRRARDEVLPLLREDVGAFST